MEIKDFYKITDSKGETLYGHLRKVENGWMYELFHLNFRPQQVGQSHGITLHGDPTYPDAWITKNLPALATINWNDLTVKTVYGDVFTLQYIAPFD